MNIKKIDPWLAHKNRQIKPTLVVLHATAGGTARSSIDHLRGLGLSYHYIIARDGKDTATSGHADGTEPIVFLCVPPEKHAFHVGSTVPAPSGQGSINKTSIGISLANLQKVSDPEPYTNGQIATLLEALGDLRREFPTLKWLTTHAAVQPWNRSDPRLIDAVALAKKVGFEWWQPTQDQINEHKPKRTTI